MKVKTEVTIRFTRRECILLMEFLGKQTNDDYRNKGISEGDSEFLNGFYSELIKETREYELR